MSGSARSEERPESKGADGAVWLVKSGDQILGPFRTTEIGDKLLSREIVIIDEISSPAGRWRLIRDEPSFSTIVEEARKVLMNGREETEIEGYTGQQNTELTPSVTEITASGVPNLTVSPTTYATTSPSLPHTPTIRDAEFVETSARAEAQGTGLKQFGVRSKVPAAAGISAQQVVMWIAACVVLFCALYMVMNAKRPSNERGVASLDFSRTVAAADHAWQRGDFGSAEKLYSQANRAKPLQLEVVTRLAPLMVQLDGQTVEAKRLLSDAQQGLDANSNERLQKELKLGHALAAMVSMDFTEAESLYRAVKADSTGAFVSEFNLGMINFLSNAFEEAAQRFSQAGDEPISIFMRARALASLPKKRGGRKEAVEALSTLTQNHFDYHQEGELLGAALLLEAGNKRGALAHVQLALDSDPDMTADHWHDPLLYQAPANWKALVGTCRRLQDSLKAKSTRALLALCLGKAGQGEEAMRVLNEGLAEDGEDPLLQAVNAQLLYNSARDEDARAALRMALVHEPVPLLARVVKARLCARHNELACAEEEWKVLLEGRTLRLAAQMGLAEIYKKRKNSDAQDLAAKALALSPRYKPALRFREEAGNL